MNDDHVDLRLDARIRRCGAASRKEVRTLLTEGRVTVNGVPAVSPSMRCFPADRVCIDGKELSLRQPSVYLLNKPSGYVSVAHHDRYPSVLELIHEPDAVSLFCIGRLDADTKGLLLLTNDGTLCERIARPENELPKTYLVDLDRPLPPEAESALAEGILLEDGSRCRPAFVRRRTDTLVELTVTEGKYHEVKRLIRHCGPLVASLCRISIGGLQLDPSLAPGEYRKLTDADLNLLFSYK